MTKDGNLDAMLFKAVRDSDVEAVERLIGKGVHADTPDREHWSNETPLMLAVSLDRYDCVQKLLALGANPNFVEEHGKSPLFFVKSVKVLESLLAKGANPNMRDKEGNSILHRICFGWTASEEKLEIIRKLVKLGLDPNAPGLLSATPLFETAGFEGNTGVAKVLLDLGADPNLCSDYDGGPLHSSCKSDEKLELTKMLIEHGADVNLQEPYRHRTPLHFAASWGAVKTLEHLLAMGADPTLADNKGEQSFECASNQSVRDVFMKLPNVKRAVEEKQRKANEVAERLVALGFLKFVAREQVGLLKAEIADNYFKDGDIFTNRIRDSFISKDLRSYIIGEEDIVEGDVLKLIESMKDALSCEGVKIDSLSQNVSEQNYTVEINGKKYNIYGSESPEDRQDSAVKNTLAVINDLLTQTGSTEKAYGIVDIDYTIVILNAELFEYTKSLGLHDKWHIRERL